MSDVIHNAAIQVSLDAAPVEAGAQRINAAITRTARTVDSLGASAGGFGALGAGSEAAAKKIEATERNLIASSQRMVATLESGKKAGADFLESLARARSVDPAGALAPYLAQLRAVEAALNDGAKAQARAAEAARVEAQAQREAAQAQSGRDVFLESLREQIRLYGRSSDEVLRFRAAQAGVASSAAPLILQLQNVRAAHDQVAAAAKAEAQAQRDAVQVQTRRDSFIASLQDQAAAIGKTRSQLLELQAAQMGVSTQAAPFIQRLREAETVVARTGISAGQTAAALRGVPAQFTDIITSIQGGQAPLTVLLQQGGQLKDMFGGVGNAAKALGGYVLGLVNPYTVAIAAVAGLAYVYHEGAAEAKAYNLAIATSGNAAGVTAGQLSDMARKVSQSIGTQGAAAEAITALVATGRVSASNIEQFSAVAIRGQRALGQAVGDTAAEFSDLAKTPAEGLVKLNEKYHFLTGAVYEQVRALQEQGRSYEAGQVAQQAFANGFDDVSSRVTANLGTMQRAIVAAKDLWKGFWDAALNVGREDSLEVQLAKVRKSIANAGKPFDAAVGGNAEDRANLKANQDKETSLQNQIALEATKSGLLADQAKFNAADLEWSQTKYQFMTRQQKLDFDLTAAKEKGLAAGISDTEIEKRLGVIRKSYADIYNDSIDSNIAALKRQSAVEDLLGRRTLDRLAFLRSSGQLTDDQSIEQNTQAELSAFDRRRVALQAELVLIRQKQNSKTAAADKQGEIDALEIERGNRKNKGEDDLFLLEQKRFRLAADNTANVIEAAQAERESLLGQYRAQVDANEAIGLTKVQLASLTAARLEELAVRRESNAEILDTIVGRENEAQAARDSAQAFRDRAKAIQEGGIKEFQFDEWKKAVDTYSGVFRTGFADMLNNGKAGWKSFTTSLVTTFKTTVADQIYKMFAEPFVIKLVASLLGVSAGATATLAQAAGGPAGAASSAGGYVSIAQSAKSAYDAITGGFASMSTSVADGVQAALYQSGLSTQIASNGAFAEAAGAVAGYAGGIAAGKVIGGAISGKYEVGGHGSAIVNIGTAAGAFFGGPIGAAIGGALGGLINRTFGMGPEEIKSRTLNGSFGANGFSGKTDTAIHQDGGFFRSDSNSIRSTAADSATSNALSSAYDQIKTASADFAKTLGINADSIKDRAQSLSIALTDDKAANQKVIADFFVGVGDSIAKELLPTIGDFSKAATEFGGVGESASATLQRIASDYAFIDVALASINSTFGAVGVGSIAAREKLVDLSGGLDAFGKGVAGFAQNYLTEAERLKPVAAQVDAALAALGFVGDTALKTRDDFKAAVLGLVDSGKLATDAGAATYAGLIKVQDGFAQLHPAIEATTDAIKGQRQALQDQLDQLTLSPAQLNAKERAKNDPSNQGLFDQVKIAEANKPYLDQIEQLLKASRSVAEQRALDVAGMDSSTLALYDRVQALKDEASASTAAADAIAKAKDAAIATAKANADAFQSFGNALADTMKNATAAANALRDFNATLLAGANSPLDLQGRRDVAAAQYTASPGDTQAQTAFIEAAKALRDAGGGGLAYARDFAQVIASNTALAASNDARAAAIPAFYRAIQEQNSAPSFVPAVPAQIYSASQGATAVSADTVSRAEFQQGQADMAATLQKIAASSAATAESLDDLANGRKAITVEG